MSGLNPPKDQSTQPTTPLPGNNCNSDTIPDDGSDNIPSDTDTKTIPNALKIKESYLFGTKRASVK